VCIGYWDAIRRLLWTWSVTSWGRSRGPWWPDALIGTLREYFSAGDVATETARRMHVSVRTATFRLAQVTHVTGYSPYLPDRRFALHAAVRWAPLPEWPRSPHRAAHEHDVHPLGAIGRCAEDRSVDSLVDRLPRAAHYPLRPVRIDRPRRPFVSGR
jgi:hypothetical protein